MLTDVDLQQIAILRKIREEKKANQTQFKIEEYLFKEQVSFVKDEARRATACNSVRSGKTTSCAADLVDTCLRFPGTTSLYITLARSSAKKIVLPELRKIIEAYKIPAKINLADLTIDFENKSHIFLSGANTESEIEKVRGLSNVALAYIDECQAFRAHIKELVEDILTKRLYDTNGRLRLIGTPGPVLSGYFYDICNSSTWNHHHWTMLQNPWLQVKSGLTPQQIIEQDCLTRGVPITHPAIQRECFGRWVYDPDSLLLHYEEATNHYEELPPGKYTYILGVDLGTKDSDSLSLLGFRDNDPTTYLVEEYVTANQLTDELGAQIKKMMEKYEIFSFPTDTGGLGLKVAEDLRARYGIPLEAADKKEKMANYRLLDNALRNGTFKAKKDSRFAQDCNILEKDNDKSTPEKIAVKGHSDSVDSALYAFKLSPAYSYTPKLILPARGTTEYDLEQERVLFDHHQAQLEKQRAMKDGEPTWQTDDRGIPPWLKFDE